MKYLNLISLTLVILIGTTSCNFKTNKANTTSCQNDTLDSICVNDDEIKTDYEDIYEEFNDTLSNDFKVLHKEFNDEIHKIYYISHTEYRDKCTPVYVLDLDKKTNKQLISNDYFKPKNYDEEIIMVSIDSHKIIGNKLYLVGNREACGSGWIIEHPIVYIDMNTDIVYGFDECAEYKFLKNNKIKLQKAYPTNIDSVDCSADYEYHTWEEIKDLK